VTSVNQRSVSGEARVNLERFVANMLRGAFSRVVGGNLRHSSHSCHRKQVANTVTRNLYNSTQSQEDVKGSKNSAASNQRREKVERPSHQHTALQFLNVQNQNVQPGIVAQKIEEILLQFLANNNVEQDGPLAFELFCVALNHYEHTRKTKLIPRLFSLTIQVIQRSGHPSAQEETYRLLWRLLKDCDKLFVAIPSVNTHHVNDAFCRVILFHTTKDKKKLDYETRQRLDRLVDRIQQLWNDPIIPLAANSEAMNAIINYLCKQSKANDAVQILRWMVENDHHQMVPHISSFSIVISAFSKLGEPEKAAEIIQWMLSAYDSGVVPAPNFACFNSLLDGWARSGRKDAGVKAEQVLEWMQQLHEGQESLDTKPDDISYAICTNAWACTPGKDSAVKAEAILRRMIDMHESGSAIGPTESAFSSVMHAWAQSGAPDRVAALLKLMEGVSKTSNRLSMTAIPYTILITAWEQLAQRANGNKKRTCGDEALRVLTHMQEINISPTAGTYNAIIMALLQVQPLDAIHFFLELEEKFRDGDPLVRLDTRSFNCGLNAIATMNKPDAAEQAMTVLQRMFQYAHDNKQVSPSETTFNIILKVLSRSRSKDAASRANKLLLEMDEMPDTKPSYISYLTCIIAWGRSEEPAKFEHVQKLLTHFKETHRSGRLAGRMTVPPYNAALSVCCHVSSPDLKADALKTALWTMAELRNLKGVHPDHTTYLSLFEAIGLFSDGKQREKLIEKELDQCISDGLVSHEVLKVVHDVSSSFFHKFFGAEKLPRDVIIPKEWSKNATGRLRQPRYASGTD
jgi:hypothetical protein